MGTYRARSRRIPGGALPVVELTVHVGPTNREPAGSSGFFCVHVFSRFLVSDY